MDERDIEISKLRLEVQKLRGDLRTSLQALDLAREIINFDPRSQRWQDRDQVLSVSAEKAMALVEFEAVSFFLVNEHDSSFELSFCVPSSAHEVMLREYERTVTDQTFALALTRNKPRVVQSSLGKDNLLLHPLASAARTRGMFLGLLKEDRAGLLDLPFNLLSMIFLATALLLESTEMYKRFRALGSDLSHALLSYQRLTVSLEEKNEQLTHEIREKERIAQALQKSREHYRAIFENSSTPVLILDEDGTILQANKETEHVFGYRREDVLGQKKKWTEYIIADDLERMINYHKLRRRDPSFVPSRYSARIKDCFGDERYCLVNVAMLPGSKKSIVSILDLTRQNDLERQLRQSQKLEALGTLAGGIAHEFNNLLHSLNLNLGLVMEHRDPGDPDYPYLEKMKAIGERAGAVVHKIMSFSRESASGLGVVSLNSVVQDVLNLLDALIPKHIDLLTCLDENITPVLGDTVQLEQVVVNLVTNALDALEGRDKGKIILRTGMVDSPERVLWGQDSRAVFLEVMDNGCGMDARTVEHIFDPFFTTKSLGRGTGLGLSTVYGILQLHRAKIECKSQPGEGTAFTIYFRPADVMGEVPDSAVDNRDAVPGETQGVSGAGTELTVLLVDDEEMILEVTKEALEEKGFMVLTANTGEMALQVVKKRGVDLDLMVLDLGLPEVSGEQVLKEALSVHPELKVLVASGYVEHPLAKDPYKYGAIGFLAKPFDLSTLEERIRAVLRGAGC